MTDNQTNIAKRPWQSKLNWLGLAMVSLPVAEYLYQRTQQDIQDPGSTADIYDLLGVFGNSLTDAKGFAALDCRNNRYVALQCDQKALQIKGTLTGDLHSTDSTATSVVGSLSAMTPWPFSQVPSSPTINNPQGHAGVTGDKVIMSIDGSNYMVTDVQKHAQTVLTDEHYDTGTHKLQVKSRSAVGEWNGAESSYADVVTFTQVTYLASVNWSDPNLTKTTATAYVLQNASGSTTNVDTAGSC